MNHFVFYSAIFLFNSYFIFDYLFKNLFKKIKFIEVIILEVILFLFYVFFLFLFRNFLFNTNEIKKSDYLVLIVIVILSFNFTYYNFKDYKYKLYETLKNRLVEGYFEFEISKVKSSYILLKVIKSFDNKYDYLLNTQAIISRNNIKNFMNNNFLIENTRFFAFAYLEFIDTYNQKLNFYFSNNIFYKVNYFYDIEFKSNSNFLNDIRKFIYKKYQDFGEHSDLIKGMVWGIDDFSYYEKQKLIKSGLYHMFVASGGNISLVFNFSFYLFYLIYYIFLYIFKKEIPDLMHKNIILIIFSTIIVWFYCLIVGFDYPLLRAFLISIITNLILFNYNDKNNIYFFIKLLFLLLIIFFIIDYKFIYSLSFKMSFISFIGIVILGSNFKNLILNIKFIDKIPNFFKFFIYYLLDSLVMSISATIFLLPVLIYYFGFVSISGIFYNVFTSFIYPIVFYLGIIYLVFNSEFFYNIIYNLLSFINYLVNQKQWILYF
ncbi:MAG: ComEC/Rec2 family competence protein [bacterium]